MRQMKDSGIEWIGQIPQEWNVRRIKFTLAEHSGGSWGTNEGEGESDCVCVRVADFNYPKLSVGFHDKMTVRSYAKKAIEEGCIKSGDILLEKSGGGDITPVGRSVLFESNEPMMCANFIEWLRPNQHFDSHFLNYWLAAAYVNGFSKRNVKQTTGIQNLDVPAFLSERIAAPVVDVQVAIADYLDRKCAEIDALIEAKEKTNALLRERRQSIIYEAVTKGLKSDAPMKDSGIEWIGQIPAHWEIVRLRSKFSFGKGLPITKADLTDSGVGVISYGQIHSKSNVGTTIKPELVRFVDNKYLGTNEASIVCDGDFIFADTSEDLSGCGNCVYVDVDYPLFAGYHTMILHPQKIDSSKYYSYLFATDAWRSQIRAQATGVKLFSITQKMLRDALLIEPTEEEKERIVTFLDEKCSLTDVVISDNEIAIQKLKEYRQSIIYEAVTGKIEI